MTDVSSIAARVVARHAGRAVAIRATSLLSPDPSRVFGIAPVRVVSEQRVQAIAFGSIDQPPRFVVSWNPLSRESDGLEPFAKALDEFVVDALQAERLPRIWLPHEPAFEMIDLLGHRYRTNQKATPPLRRMGWICRALAEEAQYPGQQAVAIAGALLRSHLVTGQSPIEDRHLGAFLAWIEPSTGVDPVREAQRRALIPAAAMLDRATDDEVERLRGIAKKNLDGAAGQTARHTIEALLETGASREWDLLVEARSAFWDLGLPGAHLDGLVRQTMERIGFSLSQEMSPPSQAHSLSRLLYEHELAMERLEDVDVRTDATTFEQARRRGRAFTGVVLGVDQQRPNRHPCSITIRTDQEVLRVRRGTQIGTRDGGVLGRVRGVREDATGRTVLEVRLERGVRGITRSIGRTFEWVDSAVYEGSFHRSKIYREMKDLALPAVYGKDLPAPVTRTIAERDLGAVAKAMRRGT